MRTNRPLTPLAPRIAALRRSGATVRAIATALAVSPVGVHGLLARLGLAGVRPRTRQPLPRSALAAIAILAHPKARRLTWRQRVVLQGRARGMTTAAIATDLGISPASVRSLVASARMVIARPWHRRPRTQRKRCDLADLMALVEGPEAG